MVKIRQVENNSKLPILVLEGKLIGKGNNELKKMCQQYAEEGKRFTVDLANIRFFDIHGIRFLQELISDHVQLINCPFYISKMIKEST
ncbi:MAG: hypothetical protein ACE5G1_07485 [bacterium]